MRQRFSSYTTNTLAFSSHVRGSRYGCTRTPGVPPFRKQKRRVRSVITILSRCSWDLYLWLRVQRERGGGGGGKRSNDKSEWIARGLGERWKRGETRAIRSSCSPRKFPLCPSSPLLLSRFSLTPAFFSHARASVHFVTVAVPASGRDERKGNKESREDHY